MKNILLSTSVVFFLALTGCDDGKSSESSALATSSLDIDL